METTEVVTMATITEGDPDPISKIPTTPRIITGAQGATAAENIIKKN